MARSDDQIRGPFQATDLLEPGVTLVHRWRPDPSAAVVDDHHAQMNGGVAGKR